MTRQEFVDAIEEFIYLYTQDYTSGVSWRMVSEEEGDWEAEVEIDFFMSKWKVPIGVDHDTKRVEIAGSWDPPCFLPLDAEGLYTYLFFQAEKKLRDFEKEHK